MLAAVGERFEPVFVEKDDEPGLVERFGVDYYPAFVWTDGAGEELARVAQPEDADEVLEGLEIALEELSGGSDDD